MNRDDFLAHLRAGNSATLGVKQVTGIMPFIVTLASYDEEHYYQRWGVMMSGDLFAAAGRVHVCGVDEVSAPIQKRVDDG